ncbi:hypothetical protein MSAN_02398900 [Mycena sanguinolenta]|uniref:Uncharacterized protein n=1 Tax=Mycena sanguinolenta TaxID=230812 RepID=A0A8H7CDV1_9AGAR|nr:hypothetical protein MSAN_02398900 [Mycena sanguinolenta]
MPLDLDIAKEVVDNILDFLHDDHLSLLSSSLVARKWVSTPRYHLFKRITINHYFPGRGHSFKDSAHSFLDLCKSPNCTILSSLRGVVLNVDSDSAPTLLQELVDVLARAPVAKLVFIDHTTSFRHPISLSWMAPHFPGLREFSYNSLDRFVLDIFTLVASFPQLHTLSLYSNTRDAAKSAITQAKPYPTVPHTVFAFLHTLRLRLFSHQSNEFMAWLQTFGDRFRLEVLDLDIFHSCHNGWGPITAVNTFFGANGAHLRAVGLRIHYEDDREVDENILLTQVSDGDLDLSGLTNLRSLSLGSHNVVAICTSLASLPNNSQGLGMLRVSFQPWIHYDDFPCTCDPRRLVDEFVAVMRGDQFAHLTAFTILVPAFFGDMGREALRVYFPRWKDTDILHIGFIDQVQFSSPDSWDAGEISLDALVE